MKFKLKKMAIYDKNGIQLSPCICAWAKYALDSKIEPNNNQSCTKKYWVRVVERIGELNDKGEVEIQNAINRYDEMFK